MDLEIEIRMRRIVMEALQSRFERSLEENDETQVKVMLSAYRNKGMVSIDKALCQCAEKGLTNMLKLLLSQIPCPDLKYSDEKGRRALHYAAFNGSMESVELLLHSGAAVNWADNEGYYALHFACQGGFSEVAAYLISRGAHMSSARTYSTGETPLHVAAAAEHVNVLEVLINAGVNVNVKTTLGMGGYTALYKAASLGKLESAIFLCEHDAELDMQDQEGKTPLHVAAEQGHAEIVKILIDSKADLTIRCKKGKTALLYAIYSKKFEALLLLIESDPSTMNIPDDDGFYPLHTAILTRNDPAAMTLINAGDDVNRRVRNLETPLHHAAFSGSVDIIRYLLNNGAHVNVHDEHGVTPLHKAQICVSRSGRTDDIRCVIVLELLQAGACINALDYRGYSPLHRCVFSDHVHRFSDTTFKMLIQHGASLKGENTTFETEGSTRHSLLMSLAWHSSKLELADYMVRAGWDISNELWINLPGKTEQHEAFHQKLRDLLKYPKNLQHSCRTIIREYLSELTGGCEILSLIAQLPIPPRLIEYLSLFTE